MKTQVDLDALVSSVGDAVVVCDAQGAITLWNKGAERMFGFTEAEALGQSLDIIIPERQRGRHWEGYAKSMETGTTRYGNDVLRVPAIDKQGRALSVAFTVAMLFEGDKASAVGAVMRDETAAFQQNRALRKRLAELEAIVAGLPPAPSPTAAHASATATTAQHSPAAVAPLFPDTEPSSGCPFKPE